eukprot:gnl/MRDRNA2_/MRDRNA2_59261_c0_seq1.p1 gnl/MRDRNA2_/MRDRNA2_59261_c0~~gnl/MRDRNA2_/MRDRNA2_59261_c0_seq1.p1  ORF type:complete len:552 (+),score=132.67 gnl/MRDRNA2_/MRDRNA2_59261_c0_seq1:144-1658(+)
MQAEGIDRVAALFIVDYLMWKADKEEDEIQLRQSVNACLRPRLARWLHFAVQQRAEIQRVLKMLTKWDANGYLTEDEFKKISSQISVEDAAGEGKRSKSQSSALKSTGDAAVTENGPRDDNSTRSSAKSAANHGTQHSAQSPIEGAASERSTSTGFSSNASLENVVLNAKYAQSIRDKLAKRPLEGASVSLESSSKRQQTSSPTTDERSVINQSQTCYAEGMKAQYYSSSQQCWIPCVVLGVRSSGEVELNVRKGYWLSLTEQTTKLRKAALAGSHSSSKSPPQSASTTDVGKPTLPLQSSQDSSAGSQHDSQQHASSPTGDAEICNDMPKLWKVLGDCRCLFRAVCRAREDPWNKVARSVKGEPLNAEQKLHERLQADVLRAELCSLMLERRTEVENFLGGEGGDSAEDFIRKMKDPMTWGDGICLHFLPDCIGRPIQVYGLNRSSKTAFDIGMHLPSDKALHVNPCVVVWYDGKAHYDLVDARWLLRREQEIISGIGSTGRS